MNEVGSKSVWRKARVKSPQQTQWDDSFTFSYDWLPPHFLEQQYECRTTSIHGIVVSFTEVGNTCITERERKKEKRTHSLIKLASEGCSRLKILSHWHFPFLCLSNVEYFVGKMTTTTVEVTMATSGDNGDNDDCHDAFKAPSRTKWIYFWTLLLHFYLFVSCWLLLNHR